MADDNRMASSCCELHILDRDRDRRLGDTKLPESRASALSRNAPYVRCLASCSLVQHLSWRPPSKGRSCDIDHPYLRLLRRFYPLSLFGSAQLAP